MDEGFACSTSNAPYRLLPVSFCLMGIQESRSIRDLSACDPPSFQLTPERRGSLCSSAGHGRDRSRRVESSVSALISNIAFRQQRLEGQRSRSCMTFTGRPESRLRDRWHSASERRVRRGYYPGVRVVVRPSQNLLPLADLVMTGDQ